MCKLKGESVMVIKICLCVPVAILFRCDRIMHQVAISFSF